MAVAPAPNDNTGNSAAGARFRQRKISVKVVLPIYNQSELCGTDLGLEPSQLHHLSSTNQQAREVHTVETGVDKNEEDEVHLQQVIHAAQQALLGSDKDRSAASTSVYIPTPDASRLWPLAQKYYSDKSFVELDLYIKFSATVEDTLGTEYNMDEEDEQFYARLTKEYPKGKGKENNKSESAKGDKIKDEPADDSDDTRPCTELEFEAICDKFEKTIDAKQPFLSMDPSTLLSFKEIRAAILQDLNSSTVADPCSQFGPEPKYISTSTLKENLSKELNYKPFVTLFDKELISVDRVRSLSKLLELFGEPVYNHWRQRKIARKGISIIPALKFEDPSANEKDNDNDPYICFRRREFRQARKTRRADNLGAERIRLLQRSLRRARELVLNVCQRELFKLQSWESEQQIFQHRCEVKSAKRVAGIKGDDHLFYPHKRKKVVVEPVEDEEYDAAVRLKREKKKSELVAFPPTTKDQRAFATPLQSEASSTQPYVKLPPSKIPDLDLLTVSSVLQEKNDAIKRAVSEKLRKRKELDRGWANVLYDPYQPLFTFSTNKSTGDIELGHIPYSSIAANWTHQFNTSHVICDRLRRAIEDSTRALPGSRTFSGASGELIPSRPFPQLQTLLSNHLKENGSQGYVSRLLASIENNDFSSYANGYPPEKDPAESSDLSATVFRLRKRGARAGQIYVDRWGLFRKPTEEIERWIRNDHEVESDEELEGEEKKEEEEKTEKPSEQKISRKKDAYHNREDAAHRTDSMWRFCDDFPEADAGLLLPFSLEPSRLNSISDDTQLIRFGSMLLSKSYDLLRESAHNRLSAIQARMRAIQNNRQQQQQYQDSNGCAVPRAAGLYGAPGAGTGFNPNRSQYTHLQTQRPHSGTGSGGSSASLSSSVAQAPKGFPSKRGVLPRTVPADGGMNYGNRSGVELKK